MRNWVLIGSLVGVLALSSACGKNASRPGSQVIPTPAATGPKSPLITSEALDQFWKTFKQSVQTQDSEKVSEWVQFPLVTSGIAHDEDGMHAMTREEFPQYFNAIFDPLTLQTIAKADPSVLQRVTEDLDGHDYSRDLQEIYSFTVHYTFRSESSEEGDEGESMKIFHFGLKQGRIVLLAVWIAG